MLAYSVTKTNSSLKTDKSMTAIPTFFFHLVINIFAILVFIYMTNSQKMQLTPVIWAISPNSA